MIHFLFDLPEIINENNRFKLKKGRANISLTVSLTDKRDEKERLLEAFLVNTFGCTVQNPVNDLDPEDLNNEEEKLLELLENLGNKLKFKFNDEQTCDFIKKLMQAQVKDSKSDDIFQLQRVILDGHVLSLHLMGKITTFGESSLAASEEDKIIPPINNIYQIIPALMEIRAIGDELINKTELDNFINELVDVTDERRRLIILVDSLINNIEMGSKGRKTSGLGSDKVHSLRIIYEKLKDLDQPINTDHCLNQIEKICEQKRNILHWWGKPHSAEEFKTLVDVLKLTQSPTTNLEINTN